MEKNCDNCLHHFMNHKRCDVMRVCDTGSKWEPEVPIVHSNITEGITVTMEGRTYKYHGDSGIAIPATTAEEAGNCVLANPSYIFPRTLLFIEEAK